jgi:predicted amidohydrolase YtcJ
MYRRVCLSLYMLQLFVLVSLFAQDKATVSTRLINYPDLIIHNAKIVTMDDLTPTGPPGKTFQAMAVKKDRIQFLGTTAEILDLAGPQTKKMDMKGRTVIPGMIDTHIHLHEGFLNDWIRDNPGEVLRYMKNFRVQGKTYDDLTKGIELVIKENMANAPPEQWTSITLPGGSGANVLDIGTTYLKEKVMDRPKLDALAPTRPVFVESEGYVLLNTKARDDYMTMYNVAPTDENEYTTMANPRVDRTLISERYFRTRIPLMANIIENGLNHFAAMGFTGFSSHINSPPVHDAYMKLTRENRMPVRFGWAHRYCQVMAVDIGGCFFRLGDSAGMGTDYFWNVGVTLGGVDNDAPIICSTNEAAPEIKSLEKCLIAPDGPYYEAVLTALKSHLRYVINHVNGDKSLDYFMDILDRVMKEDPSMTLEHIRAMRLTADHCGMYPRKEQMPRLAKFGIQFSCAAKEINATHGYAIGKIYSESYANRVGPIKTMLTSGLVVANEGSGDGMSDVNPTAFSRFFPYMTRRRSDGAILAAEEAVDRVQLLKMSTSFAASYMLKEKELGTLEPGKFADFVVLSKDYFTIPDKDIPTVYPLMVVIGGKTQVLRDEYAKELGQSATGPQLKFSWEDTYKAP